MRTSEFPPRFPASLDSQPTRLPALASVEGRQDTAAGFILTDLSLRPIYANDTALHILNFSSEPAVTREWTVFVQKRLQFILHAPQYTTNSLTIASLVSGRRRYICRSFLLDIRQGDTRPPLVALLMERPVQRQARLLEASRRFHLSPREFETVVHLTQGLTTKEIAQRMNVSPNTVKQFVRLIMSKMSVTTRSGILGKLLAG